MIAGLRSWEHWKRRYNSPPDDLIADFYIPAFARSIRYDRAVGFFSSHLLAEIAPRIDRFVAGGGRIRLITSPANLSDDDLEAIGRGEEIRDRIKLGIEQALSVPGEDPRLVYRLQLITWMVATGVLEVRIALRKTSTRYSLFHEKIGVFTDEHGNWMTFTGSPNETLGAFRHHSESFPLHRSWASEDQFEFASEERERFESLWAGDVDGVVTWLATDWMLEPMRRTFGERSPAPDDRYLVDSRHSHVSEPDGAREYVTLDTHLLPRIPQNIEIRSYQKTAINQWLSQGRGIFAMATGTGKTITALAAATQAAKAASNHGLFIIVIVPLVDLIEQWRADALRFDFRPAVCHGDMTADESRYLRRVLSAVRVNLRGRAEMVITSAATLAQAQKAGSRGELLATALDRCCGRTLVIGDEVHGLGTLDRLAALPHRAEYRIGLSATPKRHCDDLGTEKLFTYFGPVAASISIRQAIYQLHALVEYDYHLVRVPLTAIESREYRQISARIAAAITTGNDERRDLEIRKRSRLIQHASGKLQALRAIMATGLSTLTHQIIYVAEGRSPDSDTRQLEEIEAILCNEFHMTVARYYGEVDSASRRQLLEQFEAGEIQALLAMKCLDEGIDIPSARVGVILASNQNPRQFVQRRGRLLRKDPKKPKSVAILYDFIVLPDADSGLTDAERRLIEIELSRAAELADACRNREVFFSLVNLAYDLGLDPQICSWMNITGNEEMEDWTT